MLPVYLREALWLSFAGTEEPAALQVGVGKVRGLGRPWSDYRPARSPQNYVVLPGSAGWTASTPARGRSASSWPCRWASLPGPARRRRHRLEQKHPGAGLDATRPTAGPIFRRNAFGKEFVLVAGADLAADLADEARFAKHVGLGVANLRAVAGDGLFTAYNHEPNWQARPRRARPRLQP
ncbi:hypothetical protein SHIRM173S_04890 [Streptomyces hirsutus]